MPSSSSIESRLICYRRIIVDPLSTIITYDYYTEIDRPYIFIIDFTLMSCAKCTRCSRLYVISLVDRLDRVVEDLSLKIKQDKLGIKEVVNKVIALLAEIKKLR